MLVTGNSAPFNWSPPPFLTIGLAELFIAQVHRTPNATALYANGHSWSYQALYDEAVALAGVLRDQGIRTETAVGLFMERSAPMVIATLAVVLAGGAYVPLDPAYPAERLAVMCQEAKVALVLTSDELQARATFSTVSVRTLTDLPVAGTKTPLPATDPRQAAYIMFTSGSTGQPKGITVLHSGVARLVLDTNYAHITPGDRVAHAANPAFDAATFEIWGALLNGATLVILSRDTVLNPTALATAIREHSLDFLLLTTALFNQMVYHDPTLFSTLRYALFGGEAADPHAVRLLLANTPPPYVVNGYGPTECTTFALTYTATEVQPEAPSLPIGTTINHTTAFIVGEDGEIVPDGVIGELYLGGVGLARGYSHRPALTAERFVPDAFSGDAGARLYRTGDLVRRRPDGLVEYIGRNDTQVKIRGYRIELGEIEVALQRYPAVRQAAVLAQTISRDGIADKRLVAFIVADEGNAPFNDAEVQAFLATHLPTYMVPRLYVRVAKLPVTPNGKLDRRALDPLAPAFHDEEAPSPSDDDANGVLPALAAIWERLLGVSNVKPTDNFILLGGHSLLITRLAAQIRTRFEVEVGLPDLFGAETLADLAALIEERQTTTDPLALPPLTRGEVSEAYPMSFPQERIWFLSQLIPDNLAYNFQMSVRWQGNLRTDILQQAFTEIIRRHEALRSTFHSEDGIPVLRVQPPFVAEVPIVDMTHIPEGEREAAIAEVVRSGVKVVFDVTRLPLVKWVLYRFAPDDHVLLQVEHHFVHDGWSLSVLMKELKALYTAYAQGQPSPLPELQAQFGDFTRWQRQVVSGERYERLRAYWGAQLADYPPALEMPLDHPRPAQQSMRGDVVKLDLPKSLYHRLKGVAQQEGATFYMLLMAAFKSMLYRYTSQEDLVVATGVANRRAPEAEALIGMVVNTLILRTQVAGDEPFNALLRRVKRTTVEAYAHQDMPFERVVEMLQPTRDLSHIPLYQVMFSFHDSAVPTLNLPEVRGRLTEQHNRTAKCDLNIIVIPRPEQQVGAEEAGDERVTLWWEYSTDVFERATIEDLLNHYVALLEAIAEAPATPIAHLPLRLPSDDGIYAHINDTQRAYPKDTSLATLFEAQVAQNPHAVAVADGDSRITYDDLNRRANRLANALQAQGVIAGDKVGLWLERSVDNIVALVAVVKLGATYLPLDPSYPAERLAWMVEDSQPRGIIRHGRVATTHSADCPQWQMDDPAFTAEMPDHNPPTVTESEPIAYIMYTSGSTGTPKGILIPHRAVARLVLNTNYVNILPEDGIAHLSNTAFDASTFEIWGALLNGARVVVIAKETALSTAHLSAEIATQGVTVMFMTTALFNQIATHAPTAFSGLRTLYFGGEAADANAVRTVLAHQPPATFGNIYGPTEGTTFSTYYPITTLPTGARTVPIGYPVANTQLAVVDAHDSRVPVDALGELVLYGDGIAHGYLNRPELTEQKFGMTADGVRYYRTGDVVRLRRDGALDFVGRRDGQIKLRGFRIEVGEIEHALLSHSAITAATVMVHGEGEARQLVAYWVGSDELTATELRTYLRERLPEYMLPAFYMRLAAVPINPNGKIDRRALPAPTLSADMAEHLQPATTETEHRLVAIWQSVLDQETIGANAHFFEIGGHSLLAIRVVTRVREQWGMDIPLALLFQHPVLADFAAALDRSTPTSGTAMPELRAESNTAPDDADLHAQLDALSPEELAALLAEMEH
jgi:amino acid adenylation domain-containing protein